MQLAATAARAADPAPTPPPAPAIRNVFLTSRVATDQPNVTNLTTLYVPFAVTNDKDPYGGHRSTSTWVDGRSAGITLRAFTRDVAERQAAQAVLDAITASGLLQADLPPLDWKNPETGRTRLYLDRRAHFLEFDTDAPPAVAQPILQALASYEQVARRIAATAA